MHINMHYTPITTHPTALHNPLLCTQLTNTKHICVGGGKLAGMVWQQANVGMEPSRTYQSRHHNPLIQQMFVT